MNLIKAPQQPVDALPGDPDRRYRPLCSTVNWTRSPSGATYTGTAGKQRFVISPDGAGTWSLFGVDQDGVGHVLAADLPADWSAMAAALDYVDVPIVAPVFFWTTLALIVGTIITLAVASARG